MANQEFDEATEREIFKLQTELYGFTETPKGVSCNHCGKRLMKYASGLGNINERMIEHFERRHAQK